MRLSSIPRNASTRPPVSGVSFAARSTGSKFVTDVPIEITLSNGSPGILNGTILRFDSDTLPMHWNKALERWEERGESRLQPLQNLQESIGRKALSPSDELYLLEADLPQGRSVLGAVAFTNESYYHGGQMTLDGIETYGAPLYDAGYKPHHSSKKRAKSASQGFSLGRGLLWGCILDQVKRYVPGYMPDFKLSSTSSSMGFYQTLFQKIPLLPGTSERDYVLNKDGCMHFLRRVAQRKTFRKLALHKTVSDLRRTNGDWGVVNKKTMARHPKSRPGDLPRHS